MVLTFTTTHSSCFFFLLGGWVPCGMQDLSSWTRDWTWAMTVKELSSNHCTTREYPELTSFYDLQLVVLKFCVLQNHTQGIKTKFVEVQLIYNVALLILSAMQQSESVIHADAYMPSCSVWLFSIPWTVALQAPLFMGFSRQEYWSGLPLPSLGYLPDPGIEPAFPELAGRPNPPDLQGIPCKLFITNDSCFSYFIMRTNIALEPDYLGLNLNFAVLLAVWSCASYIITLCFSFLICNLG